MQLVHCINCKKNSLINTHSHHIQITKTGIQFKKGILCYHCGYTLNEKIRLMLEGAPSKRLENGQEIITK